MFAAQQAPQPPGPVTTGTGLIAGRVVDADSGQGIAGATVLLGIIARGVTAGGGVAARVVPVLADSQGRFAVTNLMPGSYFVSVERAGYSSSVAGRSTGCQRYLLGFRGNRVSTAAADEDRRADKRDETCDSGVHACLLDGARPRARMARPGFPRRRRGPLIV